MNDKTIEDRTDEMITEKWHGNEGRYCDEQFHNLKVNISYSTCERHGITSMSLGIESGEPVNKTLLQQILTHALKHIAESPKRQTVDYATIHTYWFEEGEDYDNTNAFSTPVTDYDEFGDKFI